MRRGHTSQAGPQLATFASFVTRKIETRLLWPPRRGQRDTAIGIGASSSPPLPPAHQSGPQRARVTAHSHARCDHADAPASPRRGRQRAMRRRHGAQAQGLHRDHGQERPLHAAPARARHTATRHPRESHEGHPPARAPPSAGEWGGTTPARANPAPAGGSALQRMGGGADPWPIAHEGSS